MLRIHSNRYWVLVGLGVASLLSWGPWAGGGGGGLGGQLAGMHWTHWVIAGSSIPSSTLALNRISPSPNQPPAHLLHFHVSCLLGDSFNTSCICPMIGLQSQIFSFFLPLRFPLFHACLCSCRRLLSNCSGLVTWEPTFHHTHLLFYIFVVYNHHWCFEFIVRKHCQRHNGPEDWVHLAKVTFEVISRVQTQILITFHHQNLD